MDFLTLSKQRYSCRAMSDQKVEQEKIEKILEAANAAPTAVNKQPFHIWFTDKEEDIEKIKQTTNMIFYASLFFVVGAKADEAWVRKYDQRNFADVDAAIVATHMMMEIEDLGLSTTWVGHFDAPKFKELFPQCADYDLVAMFPVGYASDEAKPAGLHYKRKDIKDLVDSL